MKTTVGSIDEKIKTRKMTKLMIIHTANIVAKEWGDGVIDTAQF